MRGAAHSPREHFADRLALYQSELIAIYNGYVPIDYGQALCDDPGVENSYIRASIHCVQRADHTLLRELVYAGLIPSGAAP
jgi:hypothetical protein